MLLSNEKAASNVNLKRPLSYLKEAVIILLYLFEVHIGYLVISLLTRRLTCGLT